MRRKRDQETRMLKPSAGDPMPDRGPRPPTGMLPHPWRMLLQLDNSSRTTIGLNLDEGRILVGRSDEGEAADLGLDFAPYEGAEYGVSRVHAAFSYDDGAIFIEDLNSTNGTRINGFQLVPNHPYRLRDGDELEFGRARVIVRFVRTAR
jgi:pSer/pThr/pTyr-binding forkhead associated (FHA) protein